MRRPESYGLLGSRTAQSEVRPQSLAIRAPRVLVRVSDQGQQRRKGRYSLNQITCGIDWAEGHHDVALLDHEGQLLARRRIVESVEGFAELITLLAEVGDSTEDLIPVAIETPRGLLVAALRATGRPVYAINPMAVARYRARHSQSRKKSDHADAVVLANILRTDAPMHRRLPADTDLVRQIAVLARAHQDATWR